MFYPEDSFDHYEQSSVQSFDLFPPEFDDKADDLLQTDYEYPYSYDHYLPPDSMSSSRQSSGTPQGSETTLPDNLFVGVDSDAGSSVIESDAGSAVNKLKRSWESFKISVSPCLLLAQDEPLEPIVQQPRDVSKKRPSVVKRASMHASRTAERASRARIPPAFSPATSDQEDSEDTGDEEYRPSPNPSSRKRRRSDYADGRSDVSESSSGSPAPVSAPRTTKRVRLSPPSRNKQASPAMSNIITRAVTTNSIDSFACPEPDCNYRQRNRRMPDFKRHLKTHVRPESTNHYAGVWCKGVPLESSSSYPIPPDAKPYKFQDRDWIGGCMHTFSRADALKRHLDNHNVTCIRGPY